MTPNPPNPANDPSARNGDKGSIDIEEIGLKGGVPEVYDIDPQGLPLPKPTEALARVGLGDIEVMSIIKMATSSGDDEKGGFNAWLVRSESGTYALINGDAVDFFDDNGPQLENPSKFMDDFAEPLDPGFEVIIGRNNSTLGTEVFSDSFNEQRDIKSMSREHVSVRISSPDPATGRQEVVITDMNSTNGTAIERTTNKDDASEQLITGIPEHIMSQDRSAEAEPSIDEIQATLADVEANIADSQYDAIRELRVARKNHMNTVERHSYGGDHSESLRKPAMNKARAIDVALKEGGDYADASMRLTGLEAEQRRLLHELKKATA